MDDKNITKLSVPKTYSKAMDAWFWTCPKCDQKIRIDLGDIAIECLINEVRVCKPCLNKHIAEKKKQNEKGTSYKDLRGL